MAMKRYTLRCLLAAAALVASQAGFAQQREQPVKVYVDGLPSHVAEQVKKHAEEGETALKKYLERTRTLHRLTWDDVTQPRVQPVSDTGGLAKEPKKHATDYK
jgi:hypothetical protein